ncbi:nitrous oxide reductase accessory protein NosL [Sulfurospirillum multivorans]|nr:nitrous oxide reductase accessory protein NosL [Sulfurospirillum multivorans]
MQKSLWVIVFAIVLALGLHANEFNKMATGEPELIQKGDEKAYCPICGMSLKMFYKTSHGVILKDGTAKQYCSIRCLAADYPAIESHISKIVVTDVKSEKLIDVKSAFYVVGSKVPGTMSMVSKLAFANEADAKAFATENGGEVMNFDAAFAKAKASLANDVDEFIKKKQKGMYPMGEKIYNGKCEKEKIHLEAFNTIAELKVGLKKTQVCGELNEQELQAVSLYLWEIVRLEAHEHKTTIHVEKDEKCPVCGMFVYKYPKWAARMNYSENGKPVSHAFDGVKDLLKFYHAPSKWGNYTKHKDAELTILVSDYYTGDAIDGMKAFYVVGSDVVGPMGKEFIPFKTLTSAQTFMKDHKGLQVVEFSKIDEALVYAQDK